jgi:hypothetical protein
MYARRNSPLDLSFLAISRMNNMLRQFLPMGERRCGESYWIPLGLTEFWVTTGAYR